MNNKKTTKDKLIEALHLDKKLFEPSRVIKSSDLEKISDTADMALISAEYAIALLEIFNTEK